MLNNRADLIAYRAQAEKDYAAQKKKIIVCAGTGCVAGGSLHIFDTLKALIELMIRTRKMVGESSGTVMRKKMRRSRAPSTRAAV